MKYYHCTICGKTHKWKSKETIIKRVRTKTGKIKNKKVYSCCGKMLREIPRKVYNQILVS